ncbi:citrate (Si)-synthase CIT3 NDAI_0B02160 [Naumovozyma dairenensis CBS 421]|uniref:Citrate synthase n=1 Tax=Naumovozyma dairenensis (strain ATCC 10597 / BCRC 20456 / CBS 421 / NBRC 0211 / NRRL Y-12639) TaxID=1071378 RepID=G0W640_NAUDC|nr:hypothetical protein NDAI_0B02160 [Naumovozyma dairenensis CBS 421]CCD23251.1 hypothetical protein NDAI_0B02160 [Naumovozyma dairenensis CBS 421]
MLRTSSFIRHFFSTRTACSVPRKSLKETLKELIPERKEKFLKLKKNYHNVEIGRITIGSVTTGMRGNKSIFWEGSTVDPNKGITFHGKTIGECQQQLPGDEFGYFHPEAILWYLMTKQIPTSQQVQHLTEELAERGSPKNFPELTSKIIDMLPPDTHPMTQLAIGLASLSRNSKFASNYQRGLISKDHYWEDTLEDSLNLISFLPILTAKIYSKLVNGGKPLGEFSVKNDWTLNICSLLGMSNGVHSSNHCNLNNEQSKDFLSLMRLYTGIHVDHEGGNVSAHATHLVNSALSDPYLSYSSGIMGLAGPLHGLAAQEVVRFLVEMNSRISSPQNTGEIEEYLWNILNSKKVIPGYGHAVLRIPDPRFTTMLKFAQSRTTEFENDENVILMQKLSTVVPDILKEHGKCKNPFPNVDSASGILFHHFGIKDLLFFTVIFGCSRSIGPLTQLVWDRIYGLPIERPKSISLTTMQNLCYQS